jgi:hypothetical protein
LFVSLRGNTLLDEKDIDANLFCMNLVKKTKEPWQIAAARWCVDHSEEFTQAELNAFIKKEHPSVHNTHIEFFFQQEIKQPSGRQHSRGYVDGTWTPPLDLVSKVTDYDELREARKNSKWAFRFALLANAIAATTLYLTYSAIY